MNRRISSACSTLVAGILFLVLLSGCMPAQEVAPDLTQPWAGALRALDPADTATPAYDLTAVYLRANDDDLQIRVDLLDFQSPKNLSLDIRIRDASRTHPHPAAHRVDGSPRTSYQSRGLRTGRPCRRDCLTTKDFGCTIASSLDLHGNQIVYYGLRSKSRDSRRSILGGVCQTFPLHKMELADEESAIITRWKRIRKDGFRILIS